MTLLSNKKAEESSPQARVPTSRRLLGSEFSIVFAFLALAVLMTWPWVLHLRDAVPDTGDPYLISWIMWWDYYQTFHDPLNLFQAPILYPYSYTLAFSEHSYGIALLFFPLYALGARPLTVLGVATIVGFAFSGYGAFRLARTLTGSNGVAWVAGIVFGFIPYRFHQLSHTQYLFAGWIPLTLEALVLFARERSWRRALWLGAAFTMNALTCIHWFVLTMIPLGPSGAYLLTRYRIWSDRDLWLRGGACLAVGALVLLPFFLPYKRVSQIYQMVRQPNDAANYSATVGNWLSADQLNKLWKGFGPQGGPGERSLFPGMLPLLLMLAAIFISRPKESRHSHDPPILEQADFEPSDSRGVPLRAPLVTPDSGHPRRDAPAVHSRGKTLLLLDTLTIISLVIAALAYGYEDGIRLPGLKNPHVTNEGEALFVCGILLFVRLCLSYPEVLRFRNDRNLIETLRARRRSEAFGIGLIWLVVGFFGSLGMNFFFHRFLFESVFLFRSIRVPARWAMIAYVGLALLAGLGAKRLAEAIARRRPRFRAEVTYSIICLVLLFEQRAAPLNLARGEPDPDAVTLYLKETPMRGGIVHLPAGGDVGNYRYVLRQADHRRPLVTAISGFGTPILTEVESLSQSSPIPHRFLQLLEEIPTSYLVVHDSMLQPQARDAVNDLLQRGIAGGRLLHIGKFAGSGINGNEGADLYAVTKVEPNARSQAPPPARLAPRELGATLSDDPTVLLRQFDDWSFPLERFYRVSFGRTPKYAEFLADAQATAKDVTIYGDRWQEKLRENLKSFAATWVKRPEFARAYAGKTNEDFVAKLFRNAAVMPDEVERAALVRGLNEGGETRASVLSKVISNGDVVHREQDTALVLMHYFGYLRRNPDDPPDHNWNGFDFWLGEFKKTHDAAGLTRAFILTGEYKALLEKEK